MSNNNVELSGYLAVCSASTVGVGKQQVLVVDGWIITDLVHLGGKHPFSAADKPAEVILDYARRSDVDLCNCGNTQSVGVNARGRLVSGPERSFLQVKHISFFDTSHPLSAGRTFATNSVKMQGDLQLVDHTTTVRIGDTEAAILEAHMVTDRSYMGGRHPIILAGKLGERVLEAYGQALKQTDCIELSATVGGSLLTIENVTYVQANYLSVVQQP